MFNRGKTIDLTYIAAIRFPTEKAHGVAIAKMGEALVKQGVRLELIAPRRRQLQQLRDTDWKKFYSIRDRFPVTRLWCLDLLWFNYYIPAWLQAFTFYLLIISFEISLFGYLIRKKSKLVYTRDMLLVPLLIILGKKVYFEAHSWPSNSMVIWFYRLIAAKLSGITCISQPLIKEFVKLGISSNKLLLAPSAVSKEFFKKRNKLQARKKLKLPLRKKIITYAGSLNQDKGILTLLRAAARLKQRKDILFLIIGGNFVEEKERSVINKTAKSANLKLLGFRPYVEIPSYLAASDILVLPNSAKSKKPIFRKYTSPLKLYEYLASGRPVIASQVAAFINIVKDKKEVLFFKPDNSQDLACKICQLLENKKLSSLLGQKGRKLVAGVDWEARAQAVLSFIHKNI